MPHATSQAFVFTAALLLISSLFAAEATERSVAAVWTGRRRRAEYVGDGRHGPLAKPLSCPCVQVTRTAGL